MKLSDLPWKWVSLRRLFLKTCVWRNRVNHNRIILDITFDCNLKCDDCNRSCGLAPSSEMMSVDQVERFLRESHEQGRRWKDIVLEGGEPTLHPQLMEILELLLAFRRDRSPSTTIILCTNGFGSHAASVLSHVPAEVTVYNSRKQSPRQPLFDAFNRAPMDMERYRHSDFTRACHIPQMWGLSLTRHGYYPCSPGAGIDRVVGMGLARRSLPEPGAPFTEEFGALCRWCGHFIRFNRTGSGKERISESWRRAFLNYEKEKPRLELY